MASFTKVIVEAGLALVHDSLYHIAAHHAGSENKEIIKLKVWLDRFGCKREHHFVPFSFFKGNRVLISEEVHLVICAVVTWLLAKEKAFLA